MDLMNYRTNHIMHYMVNNDIMQGKMCKIKLYPFEHDQNQAILYQSTKHGGIKFYRYNANIAGLAKLNQSYINAHRYFD